MARGWSLQRRLIVSILGVVAAVWGLAVWLAFGAARHDLDELLDAHLIQAASLVSPDDADPLLSARSMNSGSTRTAFQVFVGDRLVLRSDNAPAARMVEPSLSYRLASVGIEGTAWRVYSTFDAATGRQVIVGEQAGSRRDIVKAVLVNMATPLLVALPLLALAVWGAVRAATASLRRFGGSLQARQPHDDAPLDASGLPREVEPLAHALDDLLARIRTLIETERRFTADAAHELRTPVAAIRVQAQVALAEDDAGLRREALQATLQGCDRAGHLIEQLLTLSRLEAGVDVASTRFDLREPVTEAIGQLASLTAGRGQSIEADLPQAFVVDGRPALVGVLLRNLLDNASRYAGAGTTIAVSLRLDAEGASLVVEDSGPGMSADDLARLGQRFFRVLGTGESGSGLGWSIASRAAAAHGARLVAGRSARWGGFSAELRFGAKPASVPATDS